MKRVCSYCKKIFGEKKPFEDKTETHGICPECFIEVEKDFVKFEEDYFKILREKSFKDELAKEF